MTILNFDKSKCRADSCACDLLCIDWRYFILGLHRSPKGMSRGISDEVNGVGIFKADLHNTSTQLLPQ
jgi:hypothetical protein